eukprot:scaffold2588_cov197-Alexandrium_tamarense.AAC.2
MATLILRSSCSPTGNTSTHKTSAVCQSPPLQQQAHSSNRLDSSVVTVHNAHGHDHDKQILLSLPIQCDVTLLPRKSSINMHHRRDFNANISVNDVSGSVQGGILRLHQQRHSSSKTIDNVGAFKQIFHPCGMNNVVHFDYLPRAHTSSRIDGDDNRGADGGGSTKGAAVGRVNNNYLLSLTHCHVVYNSLLLPVDVLPSTFQLVKDDEGTGSSSRSSGGYYRGGDLPSHQEMNLGEVHVSFDFTDALVEVHRGNNATDDDVDSIKKEEGNVCGGRVVFSGEWTEGLMHNSTSRETTSSSSVNLNANYNLHHKQSPSEINSIMLSLEQESQLIKKALVILGSTGCIFMIALIYTVMQIYNGRRNVQRRSSCGGGGSSRRVIHIDTSYVPYEIGTVGEGRESEENKKQVVMSIPLSSQRGGNQVMIPEISPLRPSGLVRAEMNDGVALGIGLTSNTSSGGGLLFGCTKKPSSQSYHETLHLVSPFTPSDNTSDQQDSANTIANAPTARQSPRHWYEDYLSPRNTVNNKNKGRRGRNHIVFGEKENVSRSLFSPLSKSSSGGLDPVASKANASLEKEEISRSLFSPDSKGGDNDVKASATGDRFVFSPVPTKEATPEDAPRKQSRHPGITSNDNTSPFASFPINASPFSPPPSSVSLLKRQKNNVTYDSPFAQQIASSALARSEGIEKVVTKDTLSFSFPSEEVKMEKEDANDWADGTSDVDGSPTVEGFDGSCTSNESVVSTSPVVSPAALPTIDSMITGAPELSSSPAVVSSTVSSTGFSDTMSCSSSEEEPDNESEEEEDQTITSFLVDRSVGMEDQADSHDETHPVEEEELDEIARNSSVEPKISDHERKRNLIEELQQTAHFRLNRPNSAKTRSDMAGGFAEDRAFTTGTTPASPGNDFASSLTRRVVEKGSAAKSESGTNESLTTSLQIKTLRKKILTPIDQGSISSPDSNDTDVSDSFLSDYW